jgi:hypothetical protein
VHGPRRRALTIPPRLGRDKAKSLTGQIQKKEPTTGRRMIGYAPDIPSAAGENAARQGIPIARSHDELIGMVREFL